MTLKIDGPYGVNEPGKMFYLKRQVEIGEDWVFIAPNGKYIPKLAELLEIREAGEAVPHQRSFPRRSIFDGQGGKDLPLSLGNLVIHCPGQIGYPTGCQSFFKLHGATK